MKVLPRPVLVRIFSFLPLDAFPNIALTCKRYAQVLEADEIYIEKLQLFHSIRLAQVSPRHSFIDLILPLKPLFFDFKHRETDALLFRDLSDLAQTADTLAKLLRMAQAKFFTSADDILPHLDMSSTWFESRLLSHFEMAYDGKNIPQMRIAAHALFLLNGGQSCGQLFVAKNPVFFDVTYNPALFQNSLKMGSQAPATDFAMYMENIMKISNEQLDIVAQVFDIQVDAMAMLVNKLLEDSITPYISDIIKAAKDSESPKVLLHTLATVVYCCTQFLDSLHRNSTMEINLKSITDFAQAVLKPYTVDYMEHELKYLESQYQLDLERLRKLKEKAPMKEADYLNNSEKAMAHKRAVLNTVKAVLFAPVVLTTSLAANTIKLFSSPNKIKDNQPANNHSDNELNGNHGNLDKEALTSLLSLEFCLGFTHHNKEALGRALVIAYGTENKKSREYVEKIFISLLKVIGLQHIQPGFAKAIDRLAASQPKTDTEKSTVNNESLQFFDLVHVADLIQQMIEVYYQEDIKPWIDENDFLSDIIVEKKAFECLLDDSVATGLDKAIQVLVNQVEFILMSSHKLDDYNPAKEGIFDLKSTKSCQKVIACLNEHVSFFNGAADKSTLEVVYTELAVRLFTSLIKNLKRFKISQTGAMQLICDINAYFEWAKSIRVTAVTRQFSVLKEIGSLFLAEGSQEIKEVVMDSQKFQGATANLRQEDIVELLACRTDYKKIQKFVESKECIIQ